MQSIAVILGDNDFGNTFRPLLTTLALAITDHPDFTQEQVIALIAMGAKFHYAAFQNRFQYKYVSEGSYEDHFTRTAAHLTPLRVLFDAEADTACSTEDHDGGAWHLHIPSGQINSF